MDEAILLKIAQNKVVGQQSNSLKSRMKRGNNDVPRFQYKVTVLFLLKLEMFP